MKAFRVAGLLILADGAGRRLGQGDRLDGAGNVETKASFVDGLMSDKLEIDHEDPGVTAGLNGA